MEKPKKNYARTYANFLSELNMRFTDEISQIKQHCMGLESLGEVFDITHANGTDNVLLIGNPEAAVGAKFEVEEVAKVLGRKYGLKLRFK